MAGKVEAIKNCVAALGFGTVNEYTEKSIVGVLKQFAVKAGCAANVDVIKANNIAGVLNFIAENYGDEETEPFNLSVEQTHANVVVKRNNKTIAAGNDILNNGDKLKITATADEGYALSVLTVNGDPINSGDTFTVDGNVAIVATATETQPAEPEQ